MAGTSVYERTFFSRDKKTPRELTKAEKVDVTKLQVAIAILEEIKNEYGPVLAMCALDIPAPVQEFVPENVVGELEWMAGRFRDLIAQYLEVPKIEAQAEEDALHAGL